MIRDHHPRRQEDRGKYHQGQGSIIPLHEDEEPEHEGEQVEEEEREIKKMIGKMHGVYISKEREEENWSDRDHDAIQ